MALLSIMKPPLCPKNYFLEKVSEYVGFFLKRKHLPDGSGVEVPARFLTTTITIISFNSLVALVNVNLI